MPFKLLIINLNRRRSFKYYILTDNIFVQFGVSVLEDIISIPGGTNCAQHAYEAYFLQGLSIKTAN